MNEPKTCGNGFVGAGTAENNGDRTTGDCISRQDAIDAVMNTEPIVFDSQSLEPHQKTKDVIKAIEALSAQPEIIRCKDCKWSSWYTTEDGRCFCYCMETGASGRTADDYCSYGEKDGEQDD